MRDTTDDIEEKAKTFGFLIGAVGLFLLGLILSILIGIFLLVT